MAEGEEGDDDDEYTDGSSEEGSYEDESGED